MIKDGEMNRHLIFLHVSHSFGTFPMIIENLLELVKLLAVKYQK